MKGPLNFGIDHGGHQSTADSAGNRIYAIGLPDGREVFVKGHRMVTAAGAVEIWSDSSVKTWETTERLRYPTEWEPLPYPELSFTLPAGSWVHAYMCEAFMNEPWSISYLHEPTTAPRSKAATA
jgi:hypothetical protein